MLATKGLHTSGGDDWSAGVIPDTGRGELDSEQASRVGVKFDQTEKKWVYQPDGEDVRECVSIKEAALGLLSFK